MALCQWLPLLAKRSSKSTSIGPRLQVKCELTTPVMVSLFLIPFRSDPPQPIFLVLSKSVGDEEQQILGLPKPITQINRITELLILLCYHWSTL